MPPSRVFLAAACGVALLAAACTNEDLFSPAVPSYAGGALFQHYVSMGNSITAGFQSGGVNQPTQKRSSALLSCESMGLGIFPPSIHNQPDLWRFGVPTPVP